MAEVAYLWNRHCVVSMVKTNLLKGLYFKVVLFFNLFREPLFGDIECLQLPVLLCKTKCIGLSQYLKLSSRGQPSWQKGLTVWMTRGKSLEPNF